MKHSISFAEFWTNLAQLNLSLVYQFTKKDDDGPWIFFCTLTTILFKDVLGCDILLGEQKIIDTEHGKIVGSSPDDLFEKVAAQINLEQVTFNIFEYKDNPLVILHNHIDYIGMWRYNMQTERFEKLPKKDNTKV